MKIEWIDVEAGVDEPFDETRVTITSETGDQFTGRANLSFEPPERGDIEALLLAAYSLGAKDQAHKFAQNAIPTSPAPLDSDG